MNAPFTFNQLSPEVELHLQELWAQRLRAEDLFRGHSAELDSEADEDET